MSKDLKNIIDGVESNEQETSKLQEKVDRLTELTKKQKKVLSEQEQIIEVYKEKVNLDMDIPPDIIELKEIIGAQRAQLREKDFKMEHLKGTKAQLQKELELLNKQTKPLEEKYADSFGTIGELKADLITKDEKMKTYEAKIKELKTFSDKLQIDFHNEIEELHKQNKEKESKINRLLTDSEELRLFKQENFDKIDQYKKLTKLMEEEPLFKAFLIIKDVGGRGLSVEDLKNSLGSPIVLVKRFVQNLQDHELIEANEQGKLILKKN